MQYEIKMFLRLFILIIILSGIVVNINAQTKHKTDKTSVQDIIQKMRESSIVPNNYMNNLATTVELLQSIISNSDFKSESREVTAKPQREENMSACVNKPSSPIILEGIRNYALTEVNETATAYKYAVTRNEFVNVEVNWELQNDSCLPHTATVYLDNTTIVWRGNGSVTSASFVMDKGGSYKIEVELCNQHGCSSNSTELVVADTDGSHYQYLRGKVILPPIEAVLPTSGKVVAVYYTASADIYTLRDINSAKLTHLMYRSLIICRPDFISDIEEIKSCEGRKDFKVSIANLKAAIHPYPESYDFKFDPYKGNFKDLMYHKFINPNLKILATIEAPHPTLPLHNFMNETQMETFVSSVKEFLETWKFFDGIDIYWHFYSFTREIEQFVNLLKHLRHMLKQLSKENGKQYELTLASSWFDVLTIEAREEQQYIDRFHILTHDFDTYWFAYYSTLYSPDWNTKVKPIDNIIKQITSTGVSPEKIVIQVSKKGTRWEGVHNYTGVFNFTEKPSLGIRYEDITKGIVDGTWQYHYDVNAETPYVFNNDTGVFILYDDSNSVKAKAEYVIERDLAGLFLWELEVSGSENKVINDVNESTVSSLELLDAMNEELGNIRLDDTDNENML